MDRTFRRTDFILAGLVTLVAFAASMRFLPEGNRPATTKRSTGPTPTQVLASPEITVRELELFVGRNLQDDSESVKHYQLLAVDSQQNEGIGSLGVADGFRLSGQFDRPHEWYAVRPDNNGLRRIEIRLTTEGTFVYPDSSYVRPIPDVDTQKMELILLILGSVD